MGLGYWRMMGLVILPQALKLVIPGIVNTFIALFKDTSLVIIIGLFDLLNSIKQATTDPAWLGMATEGYSQLRHPLGWLGARQLGVPGTLFGLFAFVLPGLGGAWLALELRGRLPAAAGWAARIGTQLALLAAFSSFAAARDSPFSADRSRCSRNRSNVHSCPCSKLAANK